MPVPIIAAGAAAGARAVAGGAAKTAAKSTLSQGARSASQGIKPINIPANKKPPSLIRRTSESGEVISRAQRMRNNQNEAYKESNEGLETGDQEVSGVVRYRIGIALSIIFVLIAALLDLVEIIVDIFSFGAGGTIIDIVQTVFSITAFLLVGAPFWKGKKAAKKITAFIVSTLVSYIPYISSVLPEIIIGVIITLYLTRQEDREKVQDAVLQENSNITRYKRERPKIRRS